MNDGMGILGVIVGAIIVVALLFFVFGGFSRAPGPSTSVKIEAPRAPAAPTTK
jgi:hypothetical protein